MSEKPDVDLPQLQHLEKSDQEEVKKTEGAASAATIADDVFVPPTLAEQMAMRHDLHDVSIPEGFDVTPEIYNPRFPDHPCRKYPFELDPFQKNSIACLERGESVLVSAHTSAGKTVVAEYAVALALRDQQRVIYTSPIKALSNQKYRELYEEFQDVGLMTGDVTINPNASCIVMTTEILRSMLYRGSEILREIKWVIFDEIHYMRDKERGVVWEETIILLPDSVKFVFLSATIPNAKEFADWVAKLHSQPCHVVYTDFRPTPLQHYIFPEGGDGIYLVVNERGQFREDNFQKSIDALAAAPDMVKTRGKRGGSRKAGPSDLYKIVKMAMERRFDPVIIFCFSKKECERNALQMTKLDFNNEEEKKLVNAVFENAIDSLSDDDKTLPAVVNILPLLKQGIGIHHSGLLPILKEIIEILFQEGLIKALFATETFSMGLNMPAKTVVFTNVRKYDGKVFRWISSGEYIQMSGRAGRRGLDDRGIVILMLGEKMEPSICKNLIKGHADPLNSAFQLSYNMLLNLTRVEEINPEDMLLNSFHQFQNDRILPQVKEDIAHLEKQKDSIVIETEDLVSEYYHLRSVLHQLKQEIRQAINIPIHCLPFLQPGRLVKVTDNEDEWGWGVVVNFQKKTPRGVSLDDTVAAKYVVDVLLRCGSKQKEGPKGRPVPSKDEDAEMKVIPVMLELLDGISAARVFIPKDLRPKENRDSVGKSVLEVERRFPDGLPLLDPIEDMKIEDNEFKRHIRKIEAIEDRLYSNPKYKGDEILANYDLYRKKIQIQEEITNLKKQYKGAESVILRDELKSKKRILRRLGYTNTENVIQAKGRVACEINTSDELLVTELIFDGVFNNLPLEACVALASCFVFEEKSEETPSLSDEHSNLLRKLQDQARTIARISTESKLVIDPTEYCKKFSPHLMEVAESWCKGTKFVDVCKLTDVFEGAAPLLGSIIRGIRRLEEVLRQIAVAAKSIGNTDLEVKFTEAINKIKRDIVFAASLYL